MLFIYMYLVYLFNDIGETRYVILEMEMLSLCSLLLLMSLCLIVDNFI